MRIFAASAEINKILGQKKSIIGSNLETARRLIENFTEWGIGLPELDVPDLNCETYPDFTFRGNASPSVII